VKKGAPNSRVASLGTRCLELMAESWAVSERGWSTLEKYQMSLFMLTSLASTLAAIPVRTSSLLPLSVMISSTSSLVGTSMVELTV